MDIKKMFGNNVKYYRHQKKYTQEKFSELTNSNTTYISDIENGKYSVSFEKIAKFAEVLNVQVFELFIDNKSRVKLPRRVDMNK